MNKKTGKHKKSSTSKIQKHEPGVLVETAEQIEEKVKIAKDKGSEIMGKTSGMAEEFIKKVRKGVSDVGDIATKALDELNQVAQEYADKFKNTIEMKNLSNQKEILVTKLGSAVYNKMKDKDTENIYIDEEMKKIIKNLEKNDKQIIKLGKRLDMK